MDTLWTPYYTYLRKGISTANLPWCESDWDAAFLHYHKGSLSIRVEIKLS